MDSRVKTKKLKIEPRGFTIVEVLIAVTVIGALIAIALPQFASYRDRQNVGKATADMRVLDNQIQAYKSRNESYPAALSDIPLGALLDPWGKPYRYLKIEGADAKSKGSMRKDKNLVPINSDFDLYSMGTNGITAAPLTSTEGKDDIVRANNGSYYGLASKY